MTANSGSSVMEAHAELAATERPLVVDLDGTLLRSNMLIESFCALLSAAPLDAIASLAALRRGRASLKARIASAAKLDLTLLPLNTDLLVFLRAERARGRRIYLASAANEGYARAIAAELGLFDDVFASDASVNVKGATKARVLCDAFGEAGFDYVGDSYADLDVWQHAAGVIVVNASPRLRRIVQARFPHAVTIASASATAATYLRTLRPHQWLKNVLLFVPAFTGHLFTLSTIAHLVAAFVSFSLCASSVYVLNDLIDLRHDRQHPTKRLRPLASGRLDLLVGIQIFAVALLAAIGVGLVLPARFLLVLSVYYLLNWFYSTTLKRQTMLDVMMLAGFYGIRLLAGAAAVDVTMSRWLLTFSLFLFLCLALVKRVAELMERLEAGAIDPPGRGYRVTDLPLLQMMATASGYVAVLTFALYIESEDVNRLYTALEWLWAIPLILFYWISRILLLTQRGEMHDDPVLFAVRDRISIICGALTVLVMAISM